MYKHKFFLSWMIYASVTVFSLWLCLHFGLLKSVFAYDILYLNTGLGLIWALTEIKIASLLYDLSKQIEQCNILKNFLKNNSDIKLTNLGEQGIAFTSSGQSLSLINSPMIVHFENIMLKSKFIKATMLDQRVLANVFHEQLSSNWKLVNWVSENIVRIGLIGTVVGIIMTFWPFFAMTSFDIAQIKNQFGSIFSGIAVAFIPTATSMVFQILLEVSNRFLKNASNQLENEIIVIAETAIIPIVTNQSK